MGKILWIQFIVEKTVSSDTIVKSESLNYSQLFQAVHVSFWYFLEMQKNSSGQMKTIS